MNKSKESDTKLNENNEIVQRFLNVDVILEGNGLCDVHETVVLCVINGIVVLEQKWNNGLTISKNEIEINLNDPKVAQHLADTPLVLILRPFSNKMSKDLDYYSNPDNKAGANVDLLPLLLGERKIHSRVGFVNIKTGESIGCYAEVTINAGAGKDNRKPLLITMLNAVCLPRQLKEGTTYVAAIGLNNLHEPVSLNLGLSSEVKMYNYLIWGSISQLEHAALTMYTVPTDDNYVPPELNISARLKSCVVEYWNVCRRLLVEYNLLHERLETPFYVEIAGIQKIGKSEVRGRYMAFLRANVMLEPGEYNANISSKLYQFNEAGLPDNMKPLLDLPASSAKQIFRETEDAMDDFSHMSHITLRLDVTEPINIKRKIPLTLPIYKQNQTIQPCEDFQQSGIPDDNKVDVHTIINEESALRVHSELNNIANDGVIKMKKDIKKTAANRLLTQIKLVLKQFPPEKKMTIDWQDVVSSQYFATRRAVLASFSPQIPPSSPLSPFGATRSKLAQDERIIFKIQERLNNNPKNSKTFLTEALSCLEEGNQALAQEYLLKGMNLQPNNKYLLLMYGAQATEGNSESVESALSIFHAISKNSQNNDCISKAICWAARHGINHYLNKPYSAFIAAKKMRKAYQLSNDWQTFVQKWIDKTGEEEYLWNPSVIDSCNPFLISSAFFLCLRAFKLSEILCFCAECGCDFRGTQFSRNTIHVSDLYYLRAASFLLRRNIDMALEVTNTGISKCGPTAMLTQMQATAMLLGNGWNERTEEVFNRSEKGGFWPSPFLLLKAALSGVNTNAQVALQRAARAHKAAPCAYSALVLARVYLKLDEEALAERWAAAAVNEEPSFSDGWAFLACIALRKQHKDKGKALIRTAYQAGPISEDIQKDLLNLMAVLNVDFKEFLVTDICLCHN